MYIASSPTNHQEICKRYLHGVRNRKLEGATGEPLALAAAWPPSRPTLGGEHRGGATRQHAEDRGKMGQKTKEREKNEGKPKHFNDDSC